MASIDLSKQMNEILEKYADQITGEIKPIVEKVCKDSVRTLKETSPRRKKGRKHYANGWTYKQTDSWLKGYSAVIYNKSKPKLTHLLEKGHAKVNGGRVPAKEHIAPVEKKAIREFEESLKQIIGG